MFSFSDIIRYHLTFFYLKPYSSITILDKAPFQPLLLDYKAGLWLLCCIHDLQGGVQMDLLVCHRAIFYQVECMTLRVISHTFDLTPYFSERASTPCACCVCHPAPPCPICYPVSTRKTAKFPNIHQSFSPVRFPFYSSCSKAYAL